MYMNNFIEIKNLNFKYDDEYIFQDFNIEMKKNQLIYLLGNNNSGKSTLLNILLGLPYDGIINIMGMELNNTNQQKIFEEMVIIDKKMINEFAIHNNFFTLKQKENIEKYNKIIKDYEKLKISENNILNFSDKIKLKIFLELIEDKKIIIIDNLLHYLDKFSKNTIYKLLKKYKKNKLIIISSNSFDDNVLMDRIVLLDEGKIKFDGNILDVANSENIFNDLSIKIPFIIELSIKLKLYDLINDIYLDNKRMIDNIWKK